MVTYFQLIKRGETSALAIKGEGGKDKGKTCIPGEHHVVCKYHFLPSDCNVSVNVPGWLFTIINFESI